MSEVINEMVYIETRIKKLSVRRLAQNNVGTF